jgi:hypothetical protein
MNMLSIILKLVLLFYNVETLASQFICSCRCCPVAPCLAIDRGKAPVPSCNRGLCEASCIMTYHTCSGVTGTVQATCTVITTTRATQRPIKTSPRSGSNTLNLFFWNSALILSPVVIGIVMKVIM